MLTEANSPSNTTVKMIFVVMNEENFHFMTLARVRGIIKIIFIMVNVISMYCIVYTYMNK